MQRKSPLAPEHIQALKDAQRLIMEAVPLVVHLEACGPGCEYQKQQLETAANQVNNFLQHFGPGGLYEQGKDG